MAGIEEFKPSKSAGYYCMILFAVVLTAAVIMTVLMFMAERTAAFVIMLVLSLLLLGTGYMIPRLFRYSSIKVSDEDIVAVRCVFIRRTSCMPMDAVRSVTMIVTPFGESTGINFLILNAMGARLVMPFLAKSDCIRISEIIGEQIKKRSANDDN